MRICAHLCIKPCTLFTVFAIICIADASLPYLYGFDNIRYCQANEEEHKHQKYEVIHQSIPASKHNVGIAAP